MGQVTDKKQARSNLSKTSRKTSWKPRRVANAEWALMGGLISKSVTRFKLMRRMRRRGIYKMCIIAWKWSIDEKG